MTIAFIGTGKIGLPMAERLIAAGHALLVHDVRTEATAPLRAQGAAVVDSPRAAADRCRIVFLSLPSVTATRAVIAGEDGVIHGAAVKIVVNTSTVGMSFVQEMAALLAARGIVLVDCPISGGVPGTRAGTLSVMMSGDAGAIAEVRPIVSAWGRAITIAGDKPGAAQVLKLTNNILSIVALAATAEAFVMGAKAGLDPEVMLQAINAGSGRNSATDSKFPISVLDRSFDYGSEMHILMKDADLAVELGEELGVPMWVCQVTRLVYKHLVFQGAAHDDVTTIVRHVERAAGFEIPRTR